MLRSPEAGSSTQNRSAPSNTIELPVDASVTNINFGAVLPGDGTAWFDDLTIEVDGQPYSEADAFDLGFESPFPRGFYTGGSEYACSWIRASCTVANKAFVAAGVVRA